MPYRYCSLTPDNGLSYGLKRSTGRAKDVIILVQQRERLKTLILSSNSQ